MLILEDILKAKGLIKKEIVKTPLLFSKDIERKTGINLYLKVEALQKSGSFKVRGILNKLYSLTPEERKKGFITISAGNSAKSLLYATRRLGLKNPVVVVMPREVATSDRIKAIKRLGAELIVPDKDPLGKCSEIQNRRELTLIHPFDDPLIIAGHGTIGLEILDDLPDVDTIFVPIGGGGLISGIALAIKSKRPETKIIGVCASGAPTMIESVYHNEILRLNKFKTTAKGLIVPFVGKRTFKYVKRHVDDLVSISDKEIIQAMRQIWDEFKIKIEPSGAISLAPLIFKEAKISRRADAVCILSGGNIDNERFKNLLKSK